MEEKKDSKIWSTIGKISTVVFLVGGLIVIYVFLWNPSIPKLRLYARYTELPKVDNIALENYLWQFDIENTSKVLAKNARIDIPFRGRYAIDDTPNSTPLEKSIKIGDMQPGENRIINAWSYSGGNFTELKVTHDNGVAYASYPIQVYGWEAWFIKNLVMVFIMTLFIFIFTIWILLENRKPEKENKTT